MNVEMKIKEELDLLIGKNDAKIILEQIYQVAKLKGQGVKEGIPNIHLIAKEGSGITTFSKLYSNIITKYGVLEQCGSNTFLELKYPKNVEPVEYARFFQSARDAAGTQNKYWGTFVIRLLDWSSHCDLYDKNLLKLMEYVNKNKNNTKFIFHTSPEAENRQEIHTFLKRYLNIKKVFIEYPDVEVFTMYALEKLSEIDVSIDEQAKRLLKNIISELSKKSYFRGYTSVNEIACIIKYECVVQNFELKLTVETLKKIESSILYSDLEFEEKKIGFL